MTKMRTPPNDSQGFYSQDEIDNMDLDTAKYEVFRLQCILAQKKWEEQQVFEVHLFEKAFEIINAYVETDKSDYDALHELIMLLTEVRLKYWGNSRSTIMKKSEQSTVESFIGLSKAIGFVPALILSALVILFFTAVGFGIVFLIESLTAGLITAVLLLVWNGIAVHVIAGTAVADFWQVWIVIFMLEMIVLVWKLIFGSK